MSQDQAINLSYLLSAVFFIFGLKRLGSPATARSGNQLGSIGMLIAVVATLVNQEVVEYQGIIAGIVLGGLVGILLAKRIQMTAMPQLVAIFNGLGGGASALVAIAEYNRIRNLPGSIDPDVSITIMLGTFIGAVTLSGSLIAFGKLQSFLVPSNAINSILIKALNLLLFLSCLVLCCLVVCCLVLSCLVLSCVVLCAKKCDKQVSKK